MSAQQLADATARLGYAVPRSVIANLENRRRDSIGIPELLVLARALEVPPLALLFPLGRERTVEALPGTPAVPWNAARWFTGEGLPHPGLRDWNEMSEADRSLWEDSSVALFREDDKLRDSWLVARGWLLHTPETFPDAVEKARRQLIGVTDQWSRHRRRMRAEGLEPEPLSTDDGYPADMVSAVNGGSGEDEGDGGRG
jgi:hypothetical protein